MPLTLNVGLSRKTSENYNSKGVSINLIRPPPPKTVT